MRIDTTLVTIKPGVVFQLTRLKELIPDIETLLFVAKLYKLDHIQTSNLVRHVLGHNDIITALLAEGGEHSSELQDYLLELGFDDLLERGMIKLSTDAPPPKGEILPQVWESLELGIAKAIEEVVEKIGSAIQGMPGKEGSMLFQSLMTVNAKRPIIGDYKAAIKHAPHPENLVVFDVSGSMGERTVSLVAGEVVALGYMADAHLAIVSDTCTWWEPGQYSVETVLTAAEYCGTHYETLAPLFDRDWGVVVSIADYDSSYAAKDAFKQVLGSIEQVLDISLVSRPTFLSEVLGTIAKDVRPLLVAADDRCCMTR